MQKLTQPHCLKVGKKHRKAHKIHLAWACQVGVLRLNNIFWTKCDYTEKTWLLMMTCPMWEPNSNDMLRNLLLHVVHLKKPGETWQTCNQHAPNVSVAPSNQFLHLVLDIFMIKRRQPTFSLHLKQNQLLKHLVANNINGNAFFNAKSSGVHYQRFQNR